MANDFRRGIRVYLETSDYSKGISELVNQNKKLNAEYEQLKNKAETLSAAEQRRLKQLKTQIDKNAQTEVSYKQKLKETETVMNNLSGTSLKQLLEVQRRLQKEVKEATRGTAEHNIKLQQYSRVSKEVTLAQKEMNMHIGSQGNMFSRATGFVNKYWAVLGGGIAAITGLSLTFRKLAEDVAKMDDVYADVMKTTGLTRDEVLELNEAFKKMDTRTSREDLNKLASEAGKLGKTGKKDILDFVDAGNQIRVALGEDLGEDAIKNIGKMVGVFDKSTKELQTMGLKEQMLAVGSAINELGASSSANEDYLVQFAGRLGGVASQAGISIDKILGYGSALDQDMQQVEMSATALQNFIMKLMGDPAKFAKLAGVEVKGFAKLLKTDANEAIKIVLRALNEKGGFQALIPIFDQMGLDGARAVGVLSSMAGSIDKIDEAQRLASESLSEGVSITEEYNVKNTNLAAKLDKARNKFKEVSMELGQRLNPMLLTSTNATSYLIKALVQHPAVILRIIAALTAYMLVANRKFLLEKAEEVLHSIKLISLKLRIAITNQATAAELRLVGAQDALNASMKKNLWGLAAAAIAYALVYLIEYLQKMNELSGAEKINKDIKEEAIELSKQNSEVILTEKTELNNLVTAIINTNSNQELRNSLIDQLKSKYPGLLSFIDKEKISNELLAAALADVNEQYDLKLRNAALSGKSKAYENASIKASQRQIEIEEELTALRADGSKNNKKRIDELEDEYAQLSANIKKYQEQSNNYRTQIQQNNKDLKDMNTPEYYKGQMQQWSDFLTQIGEKAKAAREKGSNEELQYYNEQIKQASANYVYARQKYQELLNKKPVNTTESPSGAPTTPAKPSSGDNKKPWDAEIKNAEDTYKQEMIIYSGMLQQKLISQGMYEIISIQREINFMKEKEAILENYKQSTLDVQQDIINAQIKLQDKNQKIETPTVKALKIDSEALAEGLKIYLQNIEDKKKAEEEFAKWKKSKAQKGLEDTVAVAQFAADAISAYHQLEADSLETEKQRELKAAGNNAEEREKIEKKYAQKQLDLKKKQANVDMGVNIAMTMANGAVAIMKAWADLGPIAGPIAAGLIGVTTLIQIASIIKQRDAIMATTLDGSASSSPTSTGKRVVTQYADGSYDVIGEKDNRTYRNVPYTGIARTGIYHSPALVAERGDELIVDNPTLRNIRMNAPGVLSTIKRMRVNQYADGKYDTGSAGDNDLKAFLSANINLLTELIPIMIWLKENKIEAGVLLSDLEKKRVLWEKSNKKGSLQ